MSSSGRKAFPSERSFSWVCSLPLARGHGQVLGPSCQAAFQKDQGTHTLTSPQTPRHCPWATAGRTRRKQKTNRKLEKVTPNHPADPRDGKCYLFGLNFISSIPSQSPLPALHFPSSPPPRPPIESPLPGRPVWPPPPWPVPFLSSPLAEQTCYVVFFFLSSLSFDSTKFFFLID